jgi:hypothetical protein
MWFVVWVVSGGQRAERWGVQVQGRLTGTWGEVPVDVERSCVEKRRREMGSHEVFMRENTTICVCDIAKVHQVANW